MNRPAVKKTAISKSSPAGITYGLAAFIWWACAVFYFKAVGRAGAYEILCHRILWSVLLLLVILIISGRHRRLLQILRDRRTLSGLVVTAVLISTNWYVYVWAVIHDQISATSMAYFINPLVNVLLGYIFLKERLSPLQTAGVFLAALGVSVIWLGNGHLPAVALYLAFSFSLYGLLRKRLRVDPISGLAAETMMAAPLALIALFYLNRQHHLVFLHENLETDLLLMFAGVVTTLPLVWFVGAAKRLRYASLGLMMYIMPSLTLLFAVAVFGEQLDTIRFLGFCFIWVALAVYSYDSIRSSRVAGPAKAAADALIPETNQPLCPVIQKQIGSRYYRAPGRCEMIDCQQEEVDMFMRRMAMPHQADQTSSWLW